MTLQVLLPERILLECEVQKVVAEAENGSFGLLPHHIDFVAALVPGILSYTTDDGEAFVAVDEGVLVKCGGDVRVSVRRAVPGPDLDVLEATVRERFRVLDEQEQGMRSALMRLEIDVLRRFAKLREPPH